MYPLTEYSITGSASWTPDLWGRIRRQVESSKAGAQLNAADLANATLSAQGTLATDYFSLRYQDSLADLLRQTVAAYQRALTIRAHYQDWHHPDCHWKERLRARTFVHV